MLKRRHPYSRLGTLDGVLGKSARRTWLSWKQSLIIVTPKELHLVQNSGSAEVSESRISGTPSKPAEILILADTSVRIVCMMSGARCLMALTDGQCHLARATIETSGSGITGGRSADAV